MARIPTSQPQTEASGQINTQPASASDFAGSGTAALGAGLTDAGDTLYRVAATNEVASAQTQLAQFRANQTVRLKAAMDSSPPGDPNFAATFNAGVQDDLTKLGANFSTREGQLAFQKGAADTTAALGQAAGMYQVESAGAKAKQDYLTAVDAWGHTARTDPLQGQSLVQAATDALSDPNGPYAKMPADQRALLQRQTQEQIARATIEGYVAKDPAYAKQQLDNGPLSQFLHGESERFLNSEIRSAQAANDQRAIRVQMQAEKAQRDAANGAASDIVGRIIAAQAQGSKTQMPDPVADIANNPAFANDPAHKLQLGELVLKGLQEAQSHDQKTYGPGFYQLFQQVASGQINQSQALYGHIGPNQQDELGNPIEGPNDLTIAGLGELQKVMSGRGTPEGAAELEMKKAVMKTAYDSLTGSDPLLHIKDPNGDTQNLKFLAQFLPAWEQGKANGLTPAQMSNPDDPNYLGKIANQFKRSRQQQIADLTSANPGNLGLAQVGAIGTAAKDPLDVVKAIPNVQFSAKRQQYRDPATGAVYDANGNLVTK